MKKLPQPPYRRDKHLVRNLIEKIERPSTTQKLMRTLESHAFQDQLTRTAYHLGMSRQQVLRQVLGR